jgi:gamma-glutamyl-gamma-aminobutyrate hydrolase PuuD
MSDHRPVIGLTSYEEQARWAVWDVPSVLLPADYVRAVVAAGGIPVLLPPLPEVIEGVLPRLDGLILAGGPDIEPDRYGAEALETTGAPRVERDAAELGLISTALAAGLPVLGICRGLQLLNVARGGTLHQHLPDVLGSSEHAPAPAVYGHHPITVTPGSLLAESLGRVEAEVPSYHHQGIAALGAGLTVSAVAPDGTIEAIEDQSMAFCLAVQWHPEVSDDRSLFTALVTASRATASR